MSERLDLFATPVLKAWLPNANVVNGAMVEAIRSRRGTTTGIHRSNIGGWHSSSDMTNWGGEPARTLAEFAVTEASRHMIDVAEAGKRQFNWRVEMWANINGPGDANQLHCHPASYWSGVYYPDPGQADQEEGGGELILEDPRYPVAYMNVPDLLFKDPDAKPMYSQVPIRPEQGMLVLFPSWLRHSVRPYTGEGERISVAVNLLLSGAV